MKQRTNIVLYGYWNDVRGDRLAPRRFDIEPSQIASILAETFILECAADHQSYEFRLAGTRICEQFGWEFRGLSFHQLWDAADVEELQRAMTDALPRGGALVLDFVVAAESGGRSANFEAILLPLMHGGTTVSRVLGSIAVAQSEAWLGAVKLGKAKLIGSQVIWPEGRPHAIADKMREPTPLLSDATGAKILRFERRSFRVVDGGISRHEDGK